MNCMVELQRYIESLEFNGALLLTGEWGCGKTFLINQLIEKYKTEESSKHFVLRISLFGVSTPDAIEKRIREGILLANLESDTISEEAISKHFQRFGGLIKRILPDAAATIPSYVLDIFPIEKEIPYRKEKRELIIVLDDFERKSMDLQGILGFVNDYVENKKIKIILIADISKLKDEAFNYTSEKVIGRTIKLKPDFDQIIDSIISSYQEQTKGYQFFLNEHIDTVRWLLFASKCENLRTIKSLFIDFERIYDLLVRLEAPIDRINKFYYSFGAILFEHKKGNYSRGQYGFLSANQEVNKKYAFFDGASYALGHLSLWIVDGVWDEEGFKEEYQEAYNSKQLMPEHKLLKWHFWDLSDDIVREGVPPLLQRAYGGDLSIGDLLGLIKRLLWFRQNQIPIPCEVDYKKIHDGLDLRIQKIKNGEISDPFGSDDSDFFEQSPEVIDETEKALIDRLKKLESHRIQGWINRNKFLMDIFSDDRRVLYALKNLYYNSFDHEMMAIFYATFCSAPNSRKRDLAEIIIDFSFMHGTSVDLDEHQETIQQFGELKVRIEKLSLQETDSFARAIEISFIKQLSIKIDDFKNKLATYKS